MDVKASVRVLHDAMVFFSREIFWVNMDGDVRKIRQVVQKLMPGFQCNRVPFGDLKFATYTQIDFGV
jgi:hypothetical protein